MPKILTLPNPKLWEKSKPVNLVDKRIEKIINGMTLVLEKSESPKGIGLAAPQIGLSLRIILIRFGKTIVPFINPQIIEADKIVEGFEGCLSVPGIYGFVNRPAIITLTAISNHVFNKEEKPIVGSKFLSLNSQFDGLPARVIQHEVDHLNGILFVNRILEQKGKFYKITGKDEEGKEIFEEVTLNF